MKQSTNYISAVKVLLGFSFFGIQVLIFLVFLPFILLIYIKQKKKREKVVQTCVRFGFKNFLFFLDLICYLKINFKQVKENELSKIIICNHISLLDTVIILAYIKDCYVIVNPKFTKNILLKYIIKIYY